MRIVIDSRTVFKNGFSVEDRRYIFGCLGFLAVEKPQADFCFLVDRKIMEVELTGLGFNIIAIKSSTSNFPGSSFWANRNLLKTIRAQKADLLFTIGTPLGRDFGLPECTWLFDSRLPLFKKSSLQAVGSWLLTGPMRSKAILLERGLSGEEKIQAVPLSVEEARPILNWTEKENLKVKYAGGKEYFITRSFFSEDSLMLVLKAFSRFKKKQQSNMQLLITGMKGDRNHAGFEKLDTYKFRNDVHVYASLDEASFYQTTAAAYALILPETPGLGSGLLNAWQAQVPIMAGDEEELMQTGGTSVLYAAAGDLESFSDQMSLLFKDETLRGDLIRKGKIQAQKFKRQQSASAIWNGMMRAMSTITGNDQ
jgi:hypothetical protein